MKNYIKIARPDHWVKNAFILPGVAIAKYYGSNDSKNLKLTMNTAIIFGIVGGIAITIVSELCVPNLISLCNISEDLYAYSFSYLRIYMLSAAIFSATPTPAITSLENKLTLDCIIKELNAINIF